MLTNTQHCLLKLENYVVDESCDITRIDFNRLNYNVYICRNITWCFCACARIYEWGCVYENQLAQTTSF